MKTLPLSRAFIIIVLIMGVHIASAQIPKIKIPKVKPQPTPETQSSPETQKSTDVSNPGTPSTPPTDKSSGSTAPGSGGPYVVQAEGPASPQFLIDTLKVDLELWDYYWKVPNDNHNTSWAPRIKFDVLYGGSSKLRYKADYFMPDGTLWFSEPLESRGFEERSHTLGIYSQDDSNSDKRAIVVGGVFGLKITNIKDNTTAFQGKFKIVRFKPQYSDARYRNEVDYYVDYDWKLPIGLADLYFERDMAVPIIRMWFKGDLENNNLEARLFHNGQQIASTDDDRGGVDHGDDLYAKKRGDDKSLFWREFKFSWPSKILFIRTEDQRNYTAYKDAIYINQMPGDYVVKIYYNGEQVRETKFSVGHDGTYADNGIAKQNNLSTNKVILPVKVMGTLDKWNAVNAKAMGFYGNTVSGLTP
jgi:hypothetical protein